MDLPAGAVEEGESLVQAIAREILEETGYEGTLTEVGGHFIAAEHGVTTRVFVAQNSRQVAQPTPEQSELDEGAQVKILTIEDFKRLVRSGILTETGAAFMALDHLDLL